MTPLLVAEGVTKRFGGLIAVNRLDFTLEPGAIVSVIGPNGAGKTTFFNCVAGFYRIDEGRILFDGLPIHELRRDHIAHLGVSRTYQNIRLFANMSAMENLLVGQHHHLTSSWIEAVLGLPRVHAEERMAHEEARRLLRFIGLQGRGDTLASNLPYGDQRRLEVARALATKPRLLLLDEPTAGMNPVEQQQMTHFVRAPPPPPRRARGGHDPGRATADDGLRPAPARRARHHDPAHRARDARRDGDLRADHRARLRREDRRGHACRDPERPARHRSVPRAGQPGTGGRPGGGGGASAGPAGTIAGATGRLISMALLEVDDVHAFYGNIHALRGVSLTVEEGEIVSLIGANGAGKTTTLNTISGLVRAREGRVRLDGEDITHTPPHEIVRQGIVQVPEGRRMFARLTVEENLKMGGYSLASSAGVAAGIDRAFEMFPRLKERRHQVAGTLSGGEQQMLAISRGLMTNPKVFLLDEPSMGLAPTLVELIFETISAINKAGTTILLVEQNALMALGIASRGYILQTGQIVLTDTPDKLRHNEEVKRAYLGG